jgi:hypothetical protein
VRWRSSWCISLGCSALSSELEWNGEDLNGLCGIVLPLLRSDLPLYIEVGWVHGGLGELCLWSTWGQSLGGSCSGAMWTVAMS